MEVLALSNVWAQFLSLCCAADDGPSDHVARHFGGPSATPAGEASDARAPAIQVSVPLRVACASGQVLQLAVRDTMAVADLKEELAAASGVPAARQMLTAPGFYVMGESATRRCLEDEESIGVVYEQVLMLSDGGGEVVLELKLHGREDPGEGDGYEGGGTLPGSSTDTDILPRIQVTGAAFAEATEKTRDHCTEAREIAPESAPWSEVPDLGGGSLPVGLLASERRRNTDTHLHEPGRSLRGDLLESCSEQLPSGRQRRRTLADHGHHHHHRRRTIVSMHPRISIVAPAAGGSEACHQALWSPQNLRKSQAGFAAIQKGNSAMELVNFLASPELMGGQVVETYSMGSASSLDCVRERRRSQRHTVRHSDLDLVVGNLPSGAADAMSSSSSGSSSASSSSSSSGSESSEDELEEEPAPVENLWKRRGGVSAEACGAYNRRFVSWKMEPFEKTREESEAIMEGLRSFPPLSRVTMPVIQALASTVEIETFEDGACICSQGSVGRSGYIILEGSVEVYKEDDRWVIAKDSSAGGPPLPAEKRGVFRRTLGVGRFFGEHTMLWGFRRGANVYAKGRCRIGKVKRDTFFNLAPRYEMEKRCNREKLLKKARVFETLDDEEIAKIADCMTRKKFAVGEQLIRQGEVGQDYFIVLEGECKAEVRVGHEASQACCSRRTVGQVRKTATTTTAEEAAREAGALQEHARYYAGDAFGERGFILGEARGATVTAVTEVSVLRFKRSQFERMFGDLTTLQTEHYLHDPRMTLADFYQTGDRRGPRGVTKEDPPEEGRTEWFAVYRPTSRDAIAKMLAKKAVGKGLNVKGKSARKAHLSGYVPFLQIHEEAHMDMIEESPPDTRVKIFFQTPEARDAAMAEFQKLLAPEEGLQLLGDTTMHRLDDHPPVFGLELHERVMREAYMVRQPIKLVVGWETDRKSVPSFMDMNMHAIRGDSLPHVVLYQYDAQNHMNPHGLLMAYMEEFVKPVVSDFDTFLVGSRGMDYDEPLPQEQQELALRSLQTTGDILRKQRLEGVSEASWTDHWIEYLRRQKEENPDGFEVHLPEYGFGDPTSYRLIQEVVAASKDTGAVRHGAECFNFHFPQELDHTYLVVWKEGFREDLPWRYYTEEELRVFLLERVAEGFVFPINPVWAVRDRGWHDVFQALLGRPEAQRPVRAWYPPASGIIETIQELHSRYPGGFGAEEEVGGLARLSPETALAGAARALGELCCRPGQEPEAPEEHREHHEDEDMDPLERVDAHMFAMNAPHAKSRTWVPLVFKAKHMFKSHRRPPPSSSAPALDDRPGGGAPLSVHVCPSAGCAAHSVDLLERRRLAHECTVAENLADVVDPERRPGAGLSRLLAPGAGGAGGAASSWAREPRRLSPVAE